MRTVILSCALLLAVLLAGCSGPDENDPEADVPLTADDEVAQACFTTIPAKLSPNPVVRDIDDDGQMERIDIFRGDSKHQFLARWDVQGTGSASEAVWASATHIVVTLEAGVKMAPVQSVISKLLAQKGLRILPLDLPRTYLIGLDLDEIEADDIPRMQALLRRLPELRGIPGVAMAEPDYFVSVDQQRIPGDLKFEFQRDHLLKILAPQAWFGQTGNKNVKIAVLDSGVDAKHPDLIPNLVQGHDFLRNDNDPDDEHFHGTYCSGLVGAKGDNTEGIAGLNWDISLMPLKFIDSNGCGSTSHAAEAVRFAAKEKVDIISASWGGFGESTLLKQAIADASDVLFVASAGNHDVDIDQPQQNYIPAVFRLPNMLVVGASDRQDRQLAGTARGRQTVHLSAPGDQLLSTFLTSANEPYTSQPSGTSPAVALVAGAAALVKAENPNMTVKDLRCRLLKATDAVPALSGKSCSGGRLNVAKAVTGIGLRSNVCGCP
jgi:subtilisin family serine protease